MTAVIVLFLQLTSVTKLRPPEKARETFFHAIYALVTAEIFLIWTNVARTNVAWTNVAIIVTIF